MKHLFLTSLVLAFSSVTFASGPSLDVYPMDDIVRVGKEALVKKYEEAKASKNAGDMISYSIAPTLKRGDFDVIVAPKGSSLEETYLAKSENSIKSAGPIAMVSYIFGDVFCAIEVGVDVHSLQIVVPPTQDCL